MIKKYIDWETIGLCIDKLSYEVKKDNLKYDGIYGVPRGGIILAIKLSHVLNLPLLHYPTENTLVVDDISDTGVTLQNMKNKRIACIYTTSWTKTIPDYYIGRKKDKNEWIIFPWEDKENE